MLHDQDRVSSVTQAMKCQNELIHITEVQACGWFIEQIKRKTEVQPRDDPTEGASIGKVRAHVESTKLREILSSMNSDEDTSF
jgi:hypothetical protein